MTSRVGPKGQVVIPKPIRDQPGLRPGDEVVFVPQQGGVRVSPRGELTTWPGGSRGRGLIAALEDEHRREVRRRP